ncbi:hypothetical protein L1887_06486 [Cichorium endivia]|nr:hypothetical protein L1887_06486 [Cichorium endivia]
MSTASLALVDVTGVTTFLRLASLGATSRGRGSDMLLTGYKHMVRALPNDSLKLCGPRVRRQGTPAGCEKGFNLHPSVKLQAQCKLIEATMPLLATQTGFEHRRVLHAILYTSGYFLSCLDA